MFSAIKRIFSPVWRIFCKFMKIVAKIAAEEGMAYIIDVARRAVASAAKTDLSNREKREDAYECIKVYAKRNGIEVADRIIYKAIHDAYVEFRAGGN